MNEEIKLCAGVECRDMTCGAHAKNNDILELKKSYTVKFIDYTKTCYDYIEPDYDQYDEGEKYWIDGDNE